MKNGTRQATTIKHTLPRTAPFLRVLATRQGNTDEDDSGLARTFRHGNHGKYL